MTEERAHVIPELPEDIKTAVTVGTFDGVHRGHLAILDQLRQAASERGMRSMVITFDPHPRQVLQPDSQITLLTPTRQKLELLDKAGVDYSAVLAFSREFSQIPADRFVIDYLIGRFQMGCLVMGYDHAFGKDRSGGEKVLAELSKVYDFDLIKVPPVIEDERPVSSSWVRKSLEEGHLRQAAGLLGRWYTITGQVVEGAGRGKELGHPTANIRCEQPGGEVIPHGIYAAAVELDGELMPGALHFGPRPTYGEDEPTLELNLFDFRGDLYGRTLDVAVIERIRPVMNFSGEDELIAKMDEDDRKIKEIFAELTGGSGSLGARYFNRKFQ